MWLAVDPGLGVGPTKLANVLDAKHEEGEDKKNRGMTVLCECCCGGGEGVVICGWARSDVYI